MLIKNGFLNDEEVLFSLFLSDFTDDLDDGFTQLVDTQPPMLPIHACVCQT